MLITRRGGELFMVRQVDHGELAGEIARAWGNERFDPPAHPESACLAAARHDEGWRSWDDRPAMNEKEARPLHFLEIAMQDHIPLYRSGVEAIAALDPYAGILVGMHWTGLYRGRWGLQPNPAGLLRADRTPIQQLQDAAVAQEESRWIETKDALWSGDRSRSAFEAELWQNYDRLQAWDVFSLFICMSVLDSAGLDSEPVLLTSTLGSLDQKAGNRLVPRVPSGLGRHPQDIVLRVIEPGVVSVDPYPFREPRVSFSVRARVIPDRAYSAAEIGQVMRTAGTAEVRCDMCAHESSHLAETSPARAT